MALKPIDQIFNRWLLDRDFRAQMDENPDEALAGYDLTDADRHKMRRLSRKVRLQAKAKEVVTKVGSPKASPPPAAIYNRLPGSSNPFSLN